jgi:hypothetical protein
MGCGMGRLLRGFRGNDGTSSVVVVQEKICTVMS